MWVGLIQSVEGLNRTKRLTLLWVRGKSSCLIALSWDIGLFLLSGSNWNISSSWVLSLLAFRLELYHCISWVSSLLTVDLGTISLHNPMTQFLILCVYIHMYGSVHILLMVLFLWRTLIHSPHMCLSAHLVSVGSQTGPQAPPAFMNFLLQPLPFLGQVCVTWDKECHPPPSELETRGCERLTWFPVSPPGVSLILTGFSLSLPPLFYVHLYFPAACPVNFKLHQQTQKEELHTNCLTRSQDCIRSHPYKKYSASLIKSWLIFYLNA